jgi:transcription elongation GreA/GreB family factor
MNHWFFIGPAAGGFRCQIAQQHITVITPQSPMGMALLGKQQDDDIEVSLGNNTLNDYINQIL